IVRLAARLASGRCDMGYNWVKKLVKLKPRKGGNIPAIALTGYAAAIQDYAACAAFVFSCRSMPSIATLRSSATLHACATQPRGLCGGSPSKISDTWPRQASPRCFSKFLNHSPTNFRPAFLPNVFRYPVTYAPINQGQTVP